MDADELLAVRRDAILALSEEYGRAAAEGWAYAAHATRSRAVDAVVANRVWVAESGSDLVGWVEVNGATIESLYVRSSAWSQGIGSTLLMQAERHIRCEGGALAYLDASPNAEEFYGRRGYRRIGELKSNRSVPMAKPLTRPTV